ncbi:hypothetical protein OAB57_03085 [Bacteriovoracaceae bacterium]|nr:hypothetical protein [Bacteriovoracaceae bacterium]
MKVLCALFVALSFHAEFGFANRLKNTKIESIELNDFLSVALKENGELFYWGRNKWSPSKIVRANLVPITRISTGDRAIALDSDGRLWITGNLRYSSFEKRPLTKIEQGLPKFQKVFSGSKVFSIDESGSIWTPTNDIWAKLQTNPEKLENDKIPSFIKIYSSNFHHGAIDSTGNIWTWGESSALGHGQNNDIEIPTKILGKDLPAFKDISLGMSYSVALDVFGRIWTWGSTLEEKETLLSPQMIDSDHLPKFKSISAGQNHIIALSVDGDIWTWGEHNMRHDFGLLGHGTGEDLKAPTKIEGLPKFTQVVAGERHSIALDEFGMVWTWGNADNGKLGHGASQIHDRLVPTRIIDFNSPKGEYPKYDPTKVSRIVLATMKTFSCFSKTRDPEKKGIFYISGTFDKLFLNENYIIFSDKSDKFKEFEIVSHLSEIDQVTLNGHSKNRESELSIQIGPDNRSEEGFESTVSYVNEGTRIIRKLICMPDRFES